MLAALARLTDRDLAIADWVDRLGVLTTPQITAAFFTNVDTAARRLNQLRALDLLDRFHRPRPAGGFTSWHWVIGGLGARITAATRGQPAPSVRSLRQRRDRLADSSHLAHRLGVAQFLADLQHQARTTPGCRLVAWWNEGESAARYLGRIHPDAHGLWQQDGVTIGWFLEHDRGTEPIDRVVRKVEAYDQLARDGGPAFPVLMQVPTPQRERSLHRALAGRHGAAPVVTTVISLSADAAGCVWSLVGAAGGRRRLVHLPHQHGNPNSPYSGYRPVEGE